jgi:hypothetical protein
VNAGGIPLIIGGSSAAAARRAGTRGDGFYPYVISPEDLAARLDTARQAALAEGRAWAPDFPVTVWPGSYDPRGTFDAGLARAYRDAGANRLLCAAFEAGEDTSSEGLRRFIGQFQERVLGAL